MADIAQNVEAENIKRAEHSDSFIFIVTFPKL